MAVGLVEGTEKWGGRVVLLAGSAVSVVGGEDRFVTRRLGLLGSR